MRLLSAGRPREVLLACYTFDREDITEALVRAAGAMVSVLADKGFSLNGRCRLQQQNLCRLQAPGIEVRLSTGKCSAEEYRAAEERRAAAACSTRSSCSSTMC